MEQGKPGRTNESVIRVRRQLDASNCFLADVQGDVFAANLRRWIRCASPQTQLACVASAQERYARFRRGKRARRPN
jgi:hypothetical protein